MNNVADFFKTFARYKVVSEYGDTLGEFRNHMFASIFLGACLDKGLKGCRIRSLRPEAKIDTSEDTLF